MRVIWFGFGVLLLGAVLASCYSHTTAQRCYAPEHCLDMAGMTCGEQYAEIRENAFLRAATHPVSTVSVDIDTASYSNVRRYLNQGQLPPADAVRIEELVNYFDYDYAEPCVAEPFVVQTELSECPWNSEHELLLIGLQGRRLAKEELPPRNLVFLIDVSGSMNAQNKLPLVKKSLHWLLDELNERDKVAIVTYAGYEQVALQSTACGQKYRIRRVIDGLGAGGSTAGAAGIEAAYREAMKGYIEGGDNRVILATDGDFNVGIHDPQALVELISRKRESGVFFTVLGYGIGNLHDYNLESLADKGNGSYAYIDDEAEAQKVFGEGGVGLVTIAKDVKMQVQFSPEYVKEYRLIGYENRVMDNRDFHDDSKDAGEINSGHRVTFLYELVRNEAPDLRTLPEWSAPARVELRYKLPEEDASHLIVAQPPVERIALGEASDNLRFAAAVAAFGMLLRQSENAGDFDYSKVISLARSAKGADEQGWRGEFVGLARKAMRLDAAR